MYFDLQNNINAFIAIGDNVYLACSCQYTWTKLHTFSISGNNLFVLIDERIQVWSVVIQHSLSVLINVLPFKVKFELVTGYFIAVIHWFSFCSCCCCCFLFCFLGVFWGFFLFVCLFVFFCLFVCFFFFYCAFVLATIWSKVNLSTYARRN